MLKISVELAALRQREGEHDDIGNYKEDPIRFNPKTGLQLNHINLVSKNCVSVAVFDLV